MSRRYDKNGNEIRVVGEYISRRREQLNMSRPELQKKLKQRGHEIKSPNYIGMVENGTTPFADNEFWEKWAEALEIPKAEFLFIVLQEQHPEYLPHIQQLAKVMEKKKWTSDNPGKTIHNDDDLT